MLIKRTIGIIIFVMIGLALAAAPAFAEEQPPEPAPGLTGYKAEAAAQVGTRAAPGRGAGRAGGCNGQLR